MDFLYSTMALLKPELILPSRTRSWLNKLEDELKTSFQSDVEILREVPEYLLSLGGKRIRPALTFLTAELFGQTEPSQELLDISAGVELIHMATLLHDDIIDAAPTRRGKESALAKYGTSPTLLSGNFLFVRAFGRCAKLPSFIIKETESTCVALTEGELLEENGDFSPQNSITIAERKTGSLFGLAALSGAFVPTKSEEIALLMKQFGIALGVAFQISDDILDVTSTSDVLGKEPGTDIRERKPSIVNTLWLESKSPLADKIMLSTGEISTGDISAALKELKSSNVLELARSEGQKHINIALSTLESLRTESTATNKAILTKLFDITDFALNRLR